ncbi:hypothetical protein HBI56_064000 [Parastagonospora nodorum]|nr:hypothetical protein HBH56_198490 [Parastagonospora nodorum]KAH3924679.1 hypothetical protein HBH54_191450 [Parastagonospora nodorum]KAH3941959.1 hypothetical protein HBH53_193880 [Parastagonospora nodorum]KAH3957836.1 hypothetical protein HBH51_218910 [Parastagonospora nodorum]KAH3965979.1 hypothetical protein HBH52_201950 [Parastagonospora nodorum]
MFEMLKSNVERHDSAWDALTGSSQPPNPVTSLQNNAITEICMFCYNLTQQGTEIKFWFVRKLARMYLQTQQSG